MEIIQQIGSYAGLAAFVGLAVLAALYFSQARDVRRLRESQEEPSQAGPAPLAQQRPTPKQQGAKGAPAGAGAAAAAPRAQPTQVQAPQAARAGGPAPAAQRPAQAATAATPASSPGNGGRAGALGPRVPLPPRRPLPSQARRVAAASASTTQRQPWYRKLAPRYLVLIAAGVLVLGAGTAYGLTLLIDGGAEPAPRQADADPRSPAALDPSTITVSVLNGTTQPGLAEQAATIVEDAGFQRGNVANFSEQADTNQSVVLFADGAQAAARQVGQALDIGRVEPARQTGTELAGTADVIVIVGEDRGQAG